MRESPAAAATAVLYNGLSTELLAAYADEGSGALHALQFQETRADVGEVELLLRFDWERTAPEGAAIVLPEAGQPLLRLDEYWLMWSSGDLLFAQSAHAFEPERHHTLTAPRSSAPRRFRKATPIPPCLDAD